VSFPCGPKSIPFSNDVGTHDVNEVVYLLVCL